MKRYLIWSLAFHAVILFLGAVIAPLRGLSGPPRLATSVSVGLVDFAEPGKPKGNTPKPKLPEPAEDEVIPKDPSVKEELAEVKVPEKPKPKAETKKTGDQASKKDTAKSVPPVLASNDTGGISVGISNNEGAGDGGDVWGVELGGNTHPYYREGSATIRRNWRNAGFGRRALACVVRFRVLKSGQLVDIELEEKSGVELFDKSALRAVQVTGAWPPFPSIWDEDEQIIHFRFEHRP